MKIVFCSIFTETIYYVTLLIKKENETIYVLFLHFKWHWFGGPYLTV